MGDGFLESRIRFEIDGVEKTLGFGTFMRLP